MNGAIIPAVLYYLVSFQPSVPAAPLDWTGPMSRTDCVRIEQSTSGAWCQAIRINKERSK